MQKKGIGILCGAAVVLLLVGSIVLLTRPADGGTGDSSTESTAVTTQSAEELAALTLSKQMPENVKQISVTNKSGSYTVVRTQEATDEESVLFGVEGWTDLPTNTALIGTLANNTASLQAEQCVEEHSSEMEKFGLGENAATHVEMQFDDGSTFSFSVGDLVAGGGSNYLAVTGSDAVYTVRTSLVSNYDRAATEFLSTTILEAPADEDMPIINTITIERNDLTQPIVLEYQENANDENSGGTAATHEMVSPIRAYLSVERSTDVTGGLFGLTASEVLAAHPDDTMKAEAGLTEPFATLTKECNDGNTYVLSIGTLVQETDPETNVTTSYYPVMLEGVDVLYAVDAEDCPWATITPTGLASKLVFATYVWDIGTLNVTMKDGTSAEFTITGEDKQTAVVRRDGETVETERYRQFYSFLLQTAAEEVVLGDAPTGTPDAEIYFQTQDGTLERTVAFYKVDDFNCYITVDGVLSFQCRAAYLDTLQHNLEIFDTDEAFQVTWQ